MNMKVGGQKCEDSQKRAEKGGKYLQNTLYKIFKKTNKIFLKCNVRAYNKGGVKRRKCPMTFLTNVKKIQNIIQKYRKPRQNQSKNLKK